MVNGYWQFVKVFYRAIFNFGLEQRPLVPVDARAQYLNPDPL
jgi:hypothetical protein